MTTRRTRRTPVVRTAGLAAALAATLVLAGCAGADDQAAAPVDPAPAAASSTPSSESSGDPRPADEPTPTGGPGAEAATEPEPEVEVPPALDFEATTVAGETFDGASVAGRPVVVWFWAPWCAVCRSQVPTVTDLAATYGDEVAFVGVGSLDGAEAIAAFAGDVPGLTHLSDPDGELYQRFGIAEQSSFVVLDAAGEEALRTGYSDDDALVGVVADLAR